MNQEALEIFKALADPTRFQMMEYLTEENLTTAQLMEKLNMSQPTVYRHMQKLMQSHLVEICSSVNPQRFRLCYTGMDLTLQQLLAGDSQGRSLEEIRKEKERQRYLASRRMSDGRWNYEWTSLYGETLLEDILNAVEPGRCYTRMELLRALETRCVNGEDVVQHLMRKGILKERERIVWAFGAPQRETVYERTERSMHLQL